MIKVCNYHSMKDNNLEDLIPGMLIAAFGLTIIIIVLVIIPINITNSLPIVKGQTWYVTNRTTEVLIINATRPINVNVTAVNAYFRAAVVPFTQAPTLSSRKQLIILAYPYWSFYRANLSNLGS